MSDCVDGQWEVFFLDYGDCEHLPQSKLRGLPRSLGELPCQAIECELAYVAPIGMLQRKNGRLKLKYCVYYLNFTILFVIVSSLFCYTFLLF